MIDVPFLKHEDIAEHAFKFLDEHGDGQIPVDIEWIIESRLKMNIIPTPGLRRYLSGEGFISSDGTCIYVDEDAPIKHYKRYRFTLAHEVGHLYMHAEQLAQLCCDTIEEWKRAYFNVDARVHSKMEYQANYFAGIVLVPPQDLSREFDLRLDDVVSMIEMAQRSGIPQAACLAYAKTRLAEDICGQFEVSPIVVEKRIDADNLMERLTVAW